MLNPKEVESFLKNSFLKKVNDSYYICLLNESQGRGLDAPTNFDIEANGGISTIIAKTPKSQQEFDQFKGRTKRMCNKGQHFLFLWEKGIKESCDSFLDYHFGAVKNTELIRLNNILNQIIQYNEAVKQIDHNKVASNEGSSVSIELGDENNSDESFAGQKSTTKVKTILKKRQGAQSTGGKNQNEKKKRDQKGLCKLDLKQSKEQNDNNDKEEYKYSDNFSNKSFSCAAIQKNDKQSDTHMSLGEIVLEPNDFLKCDNLVLDEISVEQSQIISRIHFLPSENNAKLSCKAKDIQLVEKLKKKTEMFQQTRKSLRGQIEQTKEKNQRELVDDAYFAGYSKPAIHKDMLNDNIRVELYKKALDFSCKGMVVLDLGCGSGVLSGFAIKAGAKEVIGVDNADVSKFMAKKLKEMGVDFQKINYIKGSIENLSTDQIPQVDVIVSEWMGYFLLFENMVGSYIHAIQKFLKPEGIMIPSHSTMFLHAANYDLESNKIGQKYLFGNYKSVKITQCKTDDLLQNDPIIIQRLDFNDRKLENPLDKGFSSDFKIVASKEGVLNAFVGSFEVQLCNNVFLNTMPLAPATHWKQSLFFINKPIQVSKGDLIEGTIEINADEMNHRNLIVRFIYKVEGKGSSQAEECFTFE